MQNPFGAKTPPCPYLKTFIPGRKQHYLAFMCSLPHTFKVIKSEELIFPSKSYLETLKYGQCLLKGEGACAQVHPKLQTCMLFGVWYNTHTFEWLTPQGIFLLVHKQDTHKSIKSISLSKNEKKIAIMIKIEFTCRDRTSNLFINETQNMFLFKLNFKKSSPFQE